MKIRLPSRSSIFLFFFCLSLLSGLLIYLSYVKPVYAATVSISTTASAVQVDVPNRYRVIIDTTTSTNTLLQLYDRAQNDSSPTNPAYLQQTEVYDEGVYYDLGQDQYRRTPEAD